MIESLPRQRVAIFTIVVAAEALTTSLLVDVQPLLYLWGLDQIRLFFALPFVVLVAHLILNRAPVRHDEAPWPARLPFFLLAHAVSFVLLLKLSRSITETPHRTDVVLMAAWLLFGVASVVTLAATLFPIPTLIGSLRRSGRSFLAAGAVGVAAFLTALVTERAWPILQDGTLHAVATVLSVVFDDVALDSSAAIVGAADFFVTIDRACSGGEGIGLMVVLVAGYLMMRHKHLRWPAAWVMLPVAILLAGLGNIFRIAALVAVGVKISPEMALAGFHSKAGWVIACVLAFGLTTIAERWLVDAPETQDLPPDPTPWYLGPMLVSLAAALVGGLFVVDLDFGYPIRTVIVAAAVIPFLKRRRLERPNWLLSAAAGLLVFGLWMLLVKPPDAALTSVARDTLLASSMLVQVVWIGARVVGSVVVVPVVEELAFRGFLMRRIVHTDFEGVSYDSTTVLSWFVSAVVFGLLHSSVVAGIVAGLIYAIVAFRSGRLSDAIVAHGVTNGAIAIAVLWGDQWWLWL